MATEQEIAEAERARLEHVLAEFGTEGERTEVLLSTWYDGTADLKLLARLAARAQRRARFHLPPRECYGESGGVGCKCLERALDTIPGPKHEILRVAGTLHWDPPARWALPEKSEDLSEVLVEDAGRTSKNDATPTGTPPSSEAAPEPERHRVIHRKKRWWDRTNEAPSFMDTTF
jgi:hypothetical protein